MRAPETKAAVTGSEWGMCQACWNNYYKNVVEPAARDGFAQAGVARFSRIFHLKRVGYA